MLSNCCQFKRPKKKWTNHSGGKSQDSYLEKKKKNPYNPLEENLSKWDHTFKKCTFWSPNFLLCISQLGKKFREDTILIFYLEAAAKWKVVILLQCGLDSYLLDNLYKIF